MAKILTVDNEPDTVDLIESVLKNAGFEVIKALSGKEGLEKWEKEKPDLILLDIMMPDLSGWDVYQRIRTKDKIQKVAFLSVIETSEYRIQALKKEGLSDYILKPFKPEELIERVKKILNE